MTQSLIDVLCDTNADVDLFQLCRTITYFLNIVLKPEQRSSVRCKGSTGKLRYNNALDCYWNRVTFTFHSMLKGVAVTYLQLVMKLRRFPLRKLCSPHASVFKPHVPGSCGNAPLLGTKATYISAEKITFTACCCVQTACSRGSCSNAPLFRTKST
jgi:hypothetical protein